MGLLRLMGNKADVVKGLAKRCNENWRVAPTSDIVRPLFLYSSAHDFLLMPSPSGSLSIRHSRSLDHHDTESESL